MDRLDYADDLGLYGTSQSAEAQLIQHEEEADEEELLEALRKWAVTQH